MNSDFRSRLSALRAKHESLVSSSNPVDAGWDNGIYERYVNPVVTAAHVPLEWRYDLDPARFAVTHKFP